MSNVLETVVGTLPTKLQPKAKSLASAAVAGLTVVSASVHLPLWVTLALIVAQAPVVYAVPNLKPPRGGYMGGVSPVKKA